MMKDIAMSKKVTTIDEYTFEETGSTVLFCPPHGVKILISAERSYADDERIREAYFLYVVIRMLYERSHYAPLSILIDLHKTHGVPVSPYCMKQYYPLIAASLPYIKKISLVGDFFQCTPVKMLLTLVPSCKEKVACFLHYQKAKQWLKWI